MHVTTLLSCLKYGAVEGLIWICAMDWFLLLLSVMKWLAEAGCGLLLQNPASAVLEQLWGLIAHHQEAWLPMQEFGEKERGCLFKGYTDLE